jgi:hypothetical protein
LTRDATLYSKVLRKSASKRAHLWKGQRVRSSGVTGQLDHWTRPFCSGMSPGVAVAGVAQSDIFAWRVKLINLLCTDIHYYCGKCPPQATPF